MSDSVQSHGLLGSILTVTLGLWTMLTANEVAAYVTITVGLTTLFINYPKIRDRITEIYYKYFKKK